MKIIRNETIENLAHRRLMELQKVTGRPLEPPIPIDVLAERVLGLDFLWEEIEELPGETILGGLIPGKRLIILNEKHQELFAEKPGLERSTKGHEMGHWDLFIDKIALNHPSLFDEDGGPASYRSSTEGTVEMIGFLEKSPEGRALLDKIQARADEPDESRAVNRYAAAISMPEMLLYDEAMKIDRTKWPNLYDLAERFEVTITALTVRLKQLNLLHIGEDKTLYESEDAAIGQMTFDF
ncbi:MAG: hypothetical protein QGF00_21090 [Planctomycetota bacterium]|nr:hypothetical protein [Planctomycetota bacterium]MDP7252118.1 hypothetical protein [Planctomycetota bacterium]